MKNTMTEHPDLYQEMMDMLLDFFPENWEKVIFYLAYSSGSFSMKYYVLVNGAYVDCYQSGVSRTQLIAAFTDIHRKVSSVRNRLEAKQKWSVMTLIVDSEGNMHADYDYKDIDEEFIGYEKAWKAKYLS